MLPAEWEFSSGLPKFIKAKAVCSWCWWALSPQLSPSHPSLHHQPLSLHVCRATGSTEYRGVWGNTQKSPYCLQSCTPLLTSAWPTAALHVANTQREFQVSVWLFLVWTTCKTTEKKVNTDLKTERNIMKDPTHCSKLLHSALINTFRIFVSTEEEWLFSVRVGVRGYSVL